MTNSYHEAATLDDIRAGFITEERMAQQRDKSLRTLRLERQKGDGPPYVKDGREVLYPVAAYREWLAAKMVQPVRGAK